jgi:hypothetical protein
MDDMEDLPAGNADFGSPGRETGTSPAWSEEARPFLEFLEAQGEDCALEELEELLEEGKADAARKVS